MRALHVVSLSEDGRHVLLAPSKNAAATYRVPVEGRLTAAVRGDLPRQGEDTPRASSLTPKEIQSRLRAGESVEEIARSAGVPAAKVERFAGPVVSERARVIDAARAAVLERSRRGASAVPLGEAVDAHLAEVAGLDEGSVVWSARRREDGRWVVEVSYAARGRRKRAAWDFDPAQRDLHAVDASSSVLGFVDPDDGPPTRVVQAAASTSARRRRPARARAASTERRSAAAVKVPVAAKAPGAKAPAAKRSAAKAPAATVRAATVRAAKGPAAATRAATVKAPAAKAAAGAAPTAERSPAARKSAEAQPAAASRTAPAGQAPAARRTTSSAASAATRPSVPAAAKSGPAAARARRRPDAEPEPQSPPQLRVVPDPDAPPSKRASVPGWADVLLSTTPPSRADSSD